MTAHTPKIEAGKPAIERDPKRPGYCWAYRLQFDNTTTGKCYDAEQRFASQAVAEARAAVWQAGEDARFAKASALDKRAFGRTICTVARIYTHESCLTGELRSVA